jgi:predicted amidohydrolase
MADLDLTLIQPDLAWEDPGANLTSLDQVTATLPATAELVMLPEMFSTGFSMRARQLAEPMDGATVSWMLGVARKKNVILTGSVIIRERGRYYNRLVWALPNGDVAHYDKRHLFSFAGEDAVYRPGDTRVISMVKGWKVALSVCYDLRFPVWLRQPLERGTRYDLLINVANWPESRSEAWRALLRARAIENQCYTAGVNRTGTDGNGIAYAGGSVVFGPEGETIAEAGAEAGLVQCVLHKERIRQVRNQFPFLDDGDTFSLFAPKIS